MKPSTPKPPSPEDRAARRRADRVVLEVTLCSKCGPLNAYQERHLKQAIAGTIRSAVSADRRGRKGKR